MNNADGPIDALQKIARFMTGLPIGVLDDENARMAERLLYACWESLGGSDCGGMQSHKLVGRTEGMSWQPPILSFGIERHGAVAFGSVYAEIQKWTIDLATGRASYVIDRRRLVRPRDQALKTAPLADEIAAAIINRTNDARLTWLTPDRVRLEIGRIIPETNQRTTAGRRKRFLLALMSQIGPQGWRKVAHPSRHIFERVGGLSVSAA